MSLLPLVIGLWLVAIAPPGYWFELVRAERFALGVAAAVAVCAWSIAQYSQQLWSPLSELTFLASSSLLELAYPAVVVDAGRYVLGTHRFSVQIGAACSGYEGIGLVVIFTSFYLSIFRRDFRFPQALLLFPIGILAIWLFNVARIVLLIVIGDGLSPALALGGFHSQAGWISFVIVTVGLLAIAYRTAYFSVARLAKGQTASVGPPVAMLAPLVALLSSTLLTSAVAMELDWFYPVRVLATGAVLIVLWHRYDFLPHRLSPVAIGAGFMVFLLWVVLVPADPERSGTIAAALDSAPKFSVGLWFLFRLLGSVITVPLAEELAFRGYLMGRMSGWNFSPGTRLRRSWLALILSSLLFGLLHGAWVAGAIAGLIYGLVRYHRDKLADAVVAHAVTNLLLAGYVLTTGAWSLW
jgi:exosortase E/protease (VPEID-CTERM system)